MTEFDPDRLKRIDAWMRRYVDEGKFPGSTMILAQGGNIVHRATTGLRDVEQGLPFEEDTIARIYSMTKPVASVALMMLVEEGLFHLDAPVSEFIPEFADCAALVPDANSIDQVERCAPPTVAQLATHTSGLSYSFNPGPLSAALKEGGMDFAAIRPPLESQVRELARLPLAFRPGARWNYSVGIDVIGRIVEVASGQSLDVFLDERIFQPLGMKDTFFRLPDDRVGRTANLYTSLDGDPMSLGKPGGGALNLVETAEDSVYRRTTCLSGGGGLLGTIDDYFQFAEMLRKGGAHNGARILSPATLAFMRQNQLPGDIASMGPDSFAEVPMTGVGFGIGWSVVLQPGLMRVPGNVGDFSWGGIASTIFWVDPVADLTCIFFTQLMPSSSYPNRAQLKALVHGAMV